MQVKLTKTKHFITFLFIYCYIAKNQVFGIGRLDGLKGDE